jgi:para-aminobenzoate synthetase component I
MPVPAHPVDLPSGLAPADLAAQCRHLPGLIFLDSADGAGRSIIAADPVEIIRGKSPQEWENLRRTLLSRVSHAADGTPRIAAGWVEYDGSFCFGLYEHALIFDHATNRWSGIGNLHLRLRQLNPDPSPDLRFHPELSAGTFHAMVRRAQEYIRAGDIYQVNLSHRFCANWNGDPFLFYRALRRVSPAPYATFLDLGDRTILSSSPECFLRMNGRAVSTRPIKGTRPRFAEPAADERSAHELTASEKETAELIMITDLERNDLGRICDYGTVATRELLKLERFQQVFHLVSTVEGTLRAEIDHATALRSCMPGGSISGAPKKRAMEIIAELEPVPRGLYTGAIGWFGPDESEFSIAIRTVVIEENRACFHAGAGIVADSIPEAEYEETLHKAAGILLAAADARISR